MFHITKSSDHYALLSRTPSTESLSVVGTSSTQVSNVAPTSSSTSAAATRMADTLSILIKGVPGTIPIKICKVEPQEINLQGKASSPHCIASSLPSCSAQELKLAFPRTKESTNKKLSFGNQETILGVTADATQNQPKLKFIDYPPTYLTQAQADDYAQGMSAGTYRAARLDFMISRPKTPTKAKLSKLANTLSFGAAPYVLEKNSCRMLRGFYHEDSQTFFALTHEQGTNIAELFYGQLVESNLSSDPWLVGPLTQNPGDISSSIRYPHGSPRTLAVKPGALEATSHAASAEEHQSLLAHKAEPAIQENIPPLFDRSKNRLDARAPLQLAPSAMATHTQPRLDLLDSISSPALLRPVTSTYSAPLHHPGIPLTQYQRPPISLQQPHTLSTTRHMQDTKYGAMPATNTSAHAESTKATHENSASMKDLQEKIMRLEIEKKQLASEVAKTQQPLHESSATRQQLPLQEEKHHTAQATRTSSTAKREALPST